MKLISCAGYFCSGSSALTDLVSEYEGVKTLSNYEFRFLQDIDGIMDLEYHLVHNHHRHNSGHALKRFSKMAKFNHGTCFDARYERFFGGHYYEITKKYIDALTDFSYPGFWYMDMYERGRFFYYLKSIEGKIRKRVPFISDNFMPKEMTFCSHPTEEHFLALTKQYLLELFQALNPQNLPFLMVDQLLPSSNINKCLRYFDTDVKLIVVDRDPRDVYLISKYIHSYAIPPLDPMLFCKWFKYTHESNRGETPDSSHVLAMQFEDLIYCYDNEIKKVEKFIGLDSSLHTRPFNGFNPLRSVHNTQLWKTYSDPNAISIIERELKDYLYDFGKFEGRDLPGIKVNEIKQF